MKILVPLLLLITTSCLKNDFNSKLSTVSTISIKKDFEVISFNDDPFILIGKDQFNNHLKLRLFPNLTNNELEKKINQIILLYNSQFEFTTAPYPGQITTATSCGKQYKPKFIKIKNIEIMRYYATKRFGLAICDTDSFKYFQYLFFIRNSEKSIFAGDFYSLKDLSENDLSNALTNLFSEANFIKISHE